MMAIEKEIWIYWSLCSLVMMFVLYRKKDVVDPLLSSNAAETQRPPNYNHSLLLGWLATLAAAIGYIMFTHKVIVGSYKASDLLIFSFLNGVLEQFMFLFWLLVGCFFAKRYFPQHPKLTFVSGFFSFTIFSGLIHALFWKSMLPEHEPNTFIILLLLSVMSLTWMWLFWRYKTIIPILVMHVVLDFVMISYLHTNWFEACETFIRSA